MDLRKLRVLAELSRLGTMSAVARATGYGTSAVSQQLAPGPGQAGPRLPRPAQYLFSDGSGR